MLDMANDLSQIEREFYQTRLTGASAQTPINSLRMLYWKQLGLTGGTYADLERQFYRKVITDQGATPSNTRYLSLLVREAVSALGKTATPNLNQNKLTVYKNYNPV